MMRTDAQGRQLPPWEQPEWRAYERNTDLSLSLTVPNAIRLHGYLTTIIARDRHKLDALATMRAGISDEPDLSEHLIAANIRSDGQVLADLSTLIYGGTE